MLLNFAKVGEISPILVTLKAAQNFLYLRQ